MLDVFMARLDGLGIGTEVVFAFWQTESALIDSGDHLFSVVKIWFRPEVVEHRDGTAVKVCDGPGQVALVLDGVDPREERLQWLGTELLDARFVHAGGVVVADLLHPGRLVLRIGRFFQDVLENSAIALSHGGVAVPAGFIGGKRVGFAPSTAGELVKVVARVDGAIEGIEFDSKRLFGIVCRKSETGKKNSGERGQSRAPKLMDHAPPSG